jgi:inner membrane transporter RhtA
MASTEQAPADAPEHTGAAALARRVPPQLLFGLGAVSQYVGSAVAVLIFEVVPAAGVAWLRIAAAAGALALWRKPWKNDRWTRKRLAFAAAFGVTLALMNLTFYLAIDRLPLGTAVAIEFIGPITVAAVGSRTKRDGAALLLATLGVVMLADIHFAGEPEGVLLALAAGAFWASYVVLGHRIAADDELRPQDGLAAGMIIGALVVAPVLVPSAIPAITDPPLLAACIAVGLASSVVPYALEQIAMTRLPRARFALLLSLLPATAVVVGAIILQQVPTVVETGGIALVIAASMLRSHEEDEATEAV